MNKLKVFYSNFRIIDPLRHGKFIYSVKNVNGERVIIPYTPYYNTTIICDIELIIGSRFKDLQKRYDITYITIR